MSTATLTCARSCPCRKVEAEFRDAIHRVPADAEPQRWVRDFGERVATPGRCVDCGTIVRWTGRSVIALFDFEGSGSYSLHHANPEHCATAAERRRRAEEAERLKQCYVGRKVRYVGSPGCGYPRHVGAEGVIGGDVIGAKGTVMVRIPPEGMVTDDPMGIGCWFMAFPREVYFLD